MQALSQLSYTPIAFGNEACLCDDALATPDASLEQSRDLLTWRADPASCCHSKLNRLLAQAIWIWRPQGDSNPRTHRERVMS